MHRALFASASFALAGCGAIAPDTATADSSVVVGIDAPAATARVRVAQMYFGPAKVTVSSTRRQA